MGFEWGLEGGVGWVSRLGFEWGLSGVLRVEWGRMQHKLLLGW